MRKRKGIIAAFSSIGLLIVGIVIFVVSAEISGWDILATLVSPVAITCYAIIGIIGLSLLGYFLNHKYGGKN